MFSKQVSSVRSKKIGRDNVDFRRGPLSLPGSWSVLGGFAYFILCKTWSSRRHYAPLLEPWLEIPLLPVSSASPVPSVNNSHFHASDSSSPTFTTQRTKSMDADAYSDASAAARLLHSPAALSDTDDTASTGNTEHPLAGYRDYYPFGQSQRLGRDATRYRNTPLNFISKSAHRDTHHPLLMLSGQ